MELAYSFRLFTEIFFPRQCIVCHREIQRGCFCEDCRQGFLLERQLFWGSNALTWQEQRYWELEHKANELLYDGCLLYRYDAELKQLLHSLKFENRAQLLPLLREETYLGLLQGGKALQQWLKGFDIITCIPTSPERRQRRGFDVPWELFSCLKSLGLDRTYGQELLTRVRSTAPLYQLGAEQRRAELAGCFRLNSKALSKYTHGRGLKQGPSILLCDDIVTTYGTMLEAARFLLDAGAGRVSVLAFSAAKNNW